MSSFNSYLKPTKTNLFYFAILLTVFTLGRITSPIKNEQGQQQEQQQASLRRREEDNNKVERQLENRLEFVHITKTGGSAIEKAAATAGINWGACHYMKNQMMGCFTPDFTPSPKEAAQIPVTRFQSPSPWHTPLQYFVNHPFPNASTFAVVRNPYDRYISEYYCPWGGAHVPPENKDDPKVMNDYMQRRIPNESQQHWLPQHYYIYDDNGKQIVDHVLKFENLDQEFAELMAQYQLNVVLPPSHVNQSKKKLTVKDLTPETLEVINRFAARDFELFGYEMITNMDDQ